MALPEIRLSPLNYTVDHYLLREPNQWSDGEKFDLDAPYQRASVWTEDQQRALIMSMLMGLPVGSVIVSTLPPVAGPSWRVVDGKQRIEAVRALAAGTLTVPAEWFDPEDLAGPGLHAAGFMVSWDDLADRGRYKIGNSQLPALQLDANVEWVEDPEHPKAISRNSRYYPRRRTPEEALRAEAELYGLVNGGGTAQTEADMANAAAVAAGEVES